MFKMRNFVQSSKPWLNYFPSHSSQKALDIKRATRNRTLRFLATWKVSEEVVTR